MDLKFSKVVERGNSQFQLSSLVCRKDLFVLTKEMKANGLGSFFFKYFCFFLENWKFLEKKSGFRFFFLRIMDTYKLFVCSSFY